MAQMAHAGASPDVHPDHHASWRFYAVVGVILTIITAVEVAVFYIPPLEPVLVPTLLILSIAKFAGVVGYYMHLKFDHGMFTFLFVAGLVLGTFEVVALMALAHWNPGMVPPRQPVRAQMVAAIPAAAPLSDEEVAAIVDPLPDAPTAAAIAAGAEIFGRSTCVGCHAADGVGVANMGPDLTDAAWLHGDGSYKNIVATILRGVAQPIELNNVMLARGGMATLTDEQVTQVGAYVHSMSN